MPITETPVDTRQFLDPFRDDEIVGNAGSLADLIEGRVDFTGIGGDDYAVRVLDAQSGEEFRQVVLLGWCPVKDDYFYVDGALRLIIKANIARVSMVAPRGLAQMGADRVRVIYNGFFDRVGVGGSLLLSTQYLNGDPDLWKKFVVNVTVQRAMACHHVTQLCIGGECNTKYRDGTTASRYITPVLGREPTQVNGWDFCYNLEGLVLPLPIPPHPFSF